MLSVGRRGSNSGAAGVSKRAKLPAKNPMVLQKQNGSYYRVRVLKEESYRVKIGNASALWPVSICSSQPACTKQCPLYAPNNAHCMHQAMSIISPSNVRYLHQQFPLCAPNSVHDLHFTAVQCLCLHALPLHSAERTKFARQEFA